MRSFVLQAVGHLTRNPEKVTRGARTYTRFCLRNIYYDVSQSGGQASESSEEFTCVWFGAYGPFGELILRYARKGDQLIVEAHPPDSHTLKTDVAPYYDFVVDGMRFGSLGPAGATRKP